MSQQQVDAIVRALSLLIAAYEPAIEPLDLELVDNRSYTAGFRAGARSAYADAVCRLREVHEANDKAARIGAGS